MIEVSHLTKSYQVLDKPLAVLKDVSFTVEKGQIYGLIGLSGAGKSTLVRCVNRLETPQAGQILIDGEDILQARGKDLLRMRASIGMIFQHFNLFHQQTVFDNVSYPLRLHGLARHEIESRVDDLLTFVELQDKKHVYPSQLSGGQKQRVAIARALALNPKVLLSDEATSALDPTSTQMILGLLRKYVDERGLTILMITHQMEVAHAICDRVGVMADGQIIEENSVEEIFRHPQKEMTRLFVEGKTSHQDEQAFLDHLSSFGHVLRLGFASASAQKPIVSSLVKQFNMDVNILSGDIKHLVSGPVGYLYIEMDKSQCVLDEVLTFLKDHQVDVEVIR